jgi:hypothetical protein
LVRALGLTFSGDSANRCAAAIEIVRKLTELKPPALIGSPMAMNLKEHPTEFRLAYLSHELMLEHWEPLCVTDVRAAMRRIGLTPAGSAALVENYDSFVLGESARSALATIADADARDFARDFFIDQFFRRDVFIRNGPALDENERRSRLLAGYFALTQPVNLIKYKMQTSAGQLRYDNAVARNIVTALAGGPRALTDICAEFGLAQQDALANALTLSAAGALCPVERSRSKIRNLNEAIYRRLGGPEEIRYLALPCGTALPINATLLSILKGSEPPKKDEGREWHDFLTTQGI